MKKPIVLSLSLLWVHLLVAQFTISEVQTVAATDIYGYTRPRISVDDAGNPLVLWGNPDSNAVYVSRWTEAGFAEPVQINAQDVHPILYDWGGPEIAASGDHVYVTYQQMSEDMYGPVYIHHSADNGVSWSDSVRVDSPDSDEKSWLPVLGVNAETDVPIVGYMKMVDEEDHEWYVTHSYDNGQTFTEEVMVSGIGGLACDCCPAAITGGPDGEAMAFRNNNSNLRDIHVGYSINELDEDLIDFDADITNLQMNSCPASGPTVTFSGGAIVTAWRSLYEDELRIFTSSYDVQTAELTTQQVFPEEDNTQQNYPVIAGDESMLGVIWEEMQSGQRDVFFSYSTSGVSGLGEQVINLTEEMSGQQQRPHMAYRDGKFHLVFRNTADGELQYLSVQMDVSVEETLTPGMELGLSPNPANTTLKVNWAGHDGRTTAALMGVDGKVVYHEEFASRNGNNQWNVQVHTLPAGNYVVVITNGGNQYTGSVVIGER